MAVERASILCIVSKIDVEGCCFKGENLVLLDGETFTEIAKTLKFNKKTENRVDSLSLNYYFQNKIDIYPS